MVEDHGEYYCSYRPIDAGFPIALIQIEYTGSLPSLDVVAETMEKELKRYLLRFPVPSMISAFDATGRLIPVRPDGQSHMTGELIEGHIHFQWGPPRESSTVPDDELSQIYNGIPYREKEKVQEEAERQARSTRRFARLLLLYFLGGPLLFNVLSLGIDWLGLLASMVSIFIGLYRFAQAFGWVKPSKRQKEKSDRERRMRHYYYHCEKNPAGFKKLMLENFERDELELNRRQVEALRDKAHPTAE